MTLIIGTEIPSNFTSKNLGSSAGKIGDGSNSKDKVTVLPSAEATADVKVGAESTRALNCLSSDNLLTSELIDTD